MKHMNYFDLFSLVSIIWYCLQFLLTFISLGLRVNQPDFKMGYRYQGKSNVHQCGFF